MASYEKINYTLRPNKCIERKMMCEALSRLSILDHLQNYRYIGMGSPYFSDFTLFHKSLGITDLVSIEKDEAKKDRFEFNKPYSCVEMIYGNSFTILPNLELGLKKNILWLDYDDRISAFMFSDIDTYFSNAMPGSCFIISMNVEQDFMPPRGDDDEEEKISLKQFRLNQLIERLGEDKIPGELMHENFSTKNLIKLAYTMIDRQIKTSLITRNGTKKNKVAYKQIFNFLYKDNATMLTVGGLILDQPQKRKINKTSFANLPFIKTGNEPYEIKAPNLTYREIKALDTALPDDMDILRGKFTNKKLESLPLIHADIKNYAKVYRYFPTFTESNL